MIVTVKRGSDPVAVRQALVAHGLWAERFDDVDARFYISPSSAAVDPELVRRIDGVASVATRQSPTPRLDATVSVEVTRCTVKGIGKKTRELGSKTRAQTSDHFPSRSSDCSSSRLVPSNS